MSILCVGQLVADVVVRPVETLPEEGRANLVDDLELLAGGCAANTASVLAKLGVTVGLAALIGRDTLGDAILADLAAVGVQTDRVLREPTTPTSAAIVLVSSSGQRSFFYRQGGNERLTNRHVPDSVLKNARIVHLGGAMKLLELDLAELTGRAKSFGCIISLDTDWDIFGNWLHRLEGALPHIDYLMANEEEAAMLTGQQDSRAAAQDLLARGPRTVMIKRGERGSMVATRAGVTEFPAFRVDVVDTTCAGDACVAGFLLGMVRGWTLVESMRLANAAGALCTTQLSHRGVVSLEDTQRFIATQSVSRHWPEPSFAQDEEPSHGEH
jgi:sugar/nucleoside kinase (ribokinase family)